MWVKAAGQTRINPQLFTVYKKIHPKGLSSRETFGAYVRDTVSRMILFIYKESGKDADI